MSIVQVQANRAWGSGRGWRGRSQELLQNSTGDSTRALEMEGVTDEWELVQFAVPCYCSWCPSVHVCETKFERVCAVRLRSVLCQQQL